MLIRRTCIDEVISRCKLIVHLDLKQVQSDRGYALMFQAGLRKNREKLTDTARHALALCEVGARLWLRSLYILSCPPCITSGHDLPA